MEIFKGSKNQVLRTKSFKIDNFDKSLKKLIKEMKTTMEESNGQGLAAPQIGQNIRLILVSIDKKNIMTMINPEIIEISTETTVDEEGCLSLPGIWGQVERAKQIKVSFLDEKGHSQILALNDLNARIVQHECDHLEGILFIDKMLEKETEELQLETFS